MNASAKSSLCSALVLICIVIANFQGAEAQQDGPGCGDFADTCINYQLTASGIWSSDCEGGASGGSGYDSHAELSTDQYLGNNNGNLVEGSGYVEVCKNLAVFINDRSDDGVSIQADCPDTNGNFQHSYYNVNYNLANINGALNWNSC